MKNFSTLCLALSATVVSAASSAQTLPGKHSGGASSTASGAHHWEMQKVTLSEPLPDPRTGAPVEVNKVSLLVPKGWTAQAGVPKGPATDCAFNYGRLAVQVSGRGGLLLIVPGRASFWSNNRMAILQRQQYTQRWTERLAPCEIEKPKPFQEVLQRGIGFALPGAQMNGGVQPVPGLTDKVARAVQQVNARLASTGSRMEAETGQVHFHGVNKSGENIEARLIVVFTHRFDPAPGGGFLEMTDEPLSALETASAGQLSHQEFMLDAILDSIQVAPEWSSYMAQFSLKLAQMRQSAENQVARIYAQMAADNAHAAQQQAQIIAGASQYRSQVMSKVNSDRSAALDHSTQQFALHMGDQAIYNDPSTGQNFQMSSSYGHVWASSTGNGNDFILTDSPSYDPNGNAGSGSWTQMQMVR